MIGRSAIREDIALLHEIAHIHNRLLVNAGILVGTFKLAKLVFVNRFMVEEFEVFAKAFQRVEFAGGIQSTTFHDNRHGVDKAHAAFMLSTDNSTRVKCSTAFKTCTDNRSFRAEQRHCLALHVRSHQSTVSVIVFEERDKACSDRDNLLRRNVHQLNATSKSIFIDIFRVRIESRNNTLFCKAVRFVEFTASDQARLERIFILFTNHHKVFCKSRELVTIQNVSLFCFGRSACEHTVEQRVKSSSLQSRISRSNVEGVFFISRQVNNEGRNHVEDRRGLLNVICLARECFERVTVADKEARTIRVLEFEHLVHEGVEKNTLIAVEIRTDSLDILGAEFELHKQARFADKALVKAKVPLFFREVERLTRSILEFLKTDNAVRSFNEAEVVHHSESGERVDKTDVRTFRSFDRAETAVVRIVNVTDFEACTFTRKTTRTESGKTTLVREFRQRVHLIHELRELARTEERLDDGVHRTGIHQVTRSRRFVIAGSEVFTNDTAHAGKAHRELVCDKFTHRTGATVAQVVDIIEHITVGIAVETDHVFNNAEEVGFGHRHRGESRLGETDFSQKLFDCRGINLGIQTVAAHFTEIILARIIQERAFERNLCGCKVRSFFLRLVHHKVDELQCIFLRLALIGEKGIVDKEVFFVFSNERNFEDTAFRQTSSALVIENAVCVQNDFARRCVDHISCDDAAVVLFHVTRIEGHTFQILVEQVDNVCSRFKTDAAEKSRCRDLLLTVDNQIEDIAVRIEFNPSAAMRNNAALVIRTTVREEFFIEAHTRRTVQLRNDNAFSTIDDERTVIRHDRQIADHNVILDFFLQLAIFAIFFKNLKREICMQRNRMRKPAFTALAKTILWNTEEVAFVLEREELLHVCDGENVLENAFQTYFETLLLWNAFLEEVVIRSFLHFDQIRKFQLELIGGIILSLRHLETSSSEKTLGTGKTPKAHTFVQAFWRIRINEWKALLQNDLGTKVFEFLLDLFGISLRGCFLNNAIGLFDHFLSFLQAKARDCTNSLENCHLVSTAFSEDNVEFGLFFSSSTSSSCSDNNATSSGFNAVCFLEVVSQLLSFEEGETRDLITNSLDICCHDVFLQLFRFEKLFVNGCVEELGGCSSLFLFQFFRERLDLARDSGTRSKNDRDQLGKHACAVRNLGESDHIGTRSDLSFHEEALCNEEIRVFLMESFDFTCRENRIIFRANHDGSSTLECIVETRDVHLLENLLQEGILHSSVSDTLRLETLTKLVVEFDRNLLVVEKEDRSCAFKLLDKRVNFLLFFNYSFHCLSPIE